MSLNSKSLPGGDQGVSIVQCLAQDDVSSAFSLPIFRHNFVEVVKLTRVGSIAFDHLVNLESGEI